MSTAAFWRAEQESRRSIRGRARALTDEQEAKVRRLRGEGLTQKQLAERFGVGLTTIQQALARG